MNFIFGRSGTGGVGRSKTLKRRVSLPRLVLVIAAALALAFGGSRWVMMAIPEPNNENPIWFAPYVDTTLTPLFHFEDAFEMPARDVVLGFIVADATDPCQPSWGTFYSLDAAARALDLDRRVVRLRERGGDAIVSFGGALNKELAVACSDDGRLLEAYQAVVERYDLTVLDFDIEGAALADARANQRRATALKELQRKNESLQIWLTLPVAPHGLLPESVHLIQEILAAGVEVAGVNVMTMDYGGSKRADMSMREATLSALRNTGMQLLNTYMTAGRPKTEEEIWALMGATPMIGQNDVPEEEFSLEDARWLLGFAREVRLGRLSFWSINRDVQCGPGVDDKRVSNTCSGLRQELREFASIFAGREPFIRAEPAAGALTGTPATGTRADGLNHDDPRTSPYPIWRPLRAYEAGDKVVWQDRVYQAKWWSQGDQPDAAVKYVWETPWRYLGPVLESDRAAVLKRSLAASKSRQRWDSESIYIAGDEVEHLVSIDGRQYKYAFRARWWTQGTEPQEDPDRPYDHPWENIGQASDTSGEESPTPTNDR